MKLIPFLSSVALSSALFFSACGKDDDTTTPSGSVVPTENFTTYTGEYAYTTTTGLPVVDTKAKATVKDLGSNKLQITFSPANAPTFSVSMKKDGGTYVNTDFSTQVGITFDGSRLSIGANSANPVYQLAFNGSR